MKTISSLGAHRRAVLGSALGAAGLCLTGARSAFAAAPVDGDGFTCSVLGDLNAPRPRKVSQGLLLHGGGDWSTGAFNWFTGKAGNGRIVALSASPDNEIGETLYNTIGGVTAVQTFVFKQRKASSNSKVLDAIANADGVFLGGGDQANYVNYWKNTPLSQALDKHVKNGRPLGGTSAGLAILGAYSYGALDGGSVTSAQALAHPLGPANTLVRDFLHLPYLGSVITDSHFTQRERLGRLIAWVARLTSEENDVGITGVGVDEQTGLCIDKTGSGRVFSNIGGHASIVRPLRQANTLEKGEPLLFKDVPVVVMNEASRIDMASFSVSNPAFSQTVTAKDGKLVTTPAT